MLAAALIYGWHCGDASHAADRGANSRFFLQEYSGADADFMSGGGAAFVGNALESFSCSQALLYPDREA
jgi:hypothetical protein